MTRQVKQFLYTEVLYGIGIGLYSMVFNLHLLAIGLNERDIGMLTSTGILVMGCLSLPIGLSAARLGRKRILIVGEILCGAGILLLGFADSLPLCLAAHIITCAGLASIETTEIQLLFGFCKSRQEENRAFNLMFAVFTAFTGVGNLLAGLLSKHTAGMLTTSYQWPLLAGAAVVMLLALARSAIFPSDRVSVLENGPAQPQPSFRQGAWMGIRNRTLWLFAINTFFLGIIFSLIGPFANLFLKFRADWGDGPISYYYSLSGVLLLIVSLVVPWMTERWDEKRVFLGTYLGNIVIFILLFFSLPNLLFVPLLMARSGSYTLLSNLVDSYSMSSMPEEHRNLYAGMRAIFRSTGSSLAVYATGYFLAQKDYYTPFMIGAVLLAINAFFFVTMVLPSMKLRHQRKESEVKT